MLNEIENKERESNDSDDDSKKGVKRKRDEESLESYDEEYEDDDEENSDISDEEEEDEEEGESLSEEESEEEEYDSEDEYEENSSEDESSVVPTNTTQSKPTNSYQIIKNNDSDDSSDTNKPSSYREVCAICLSKMKGEIGSPELCDHSFCLECILEWAKTNTSCPQDRTQFLQVFVRKRVKGKIIRTIRVEEAKPDDTPPDDDDEEPTFCEVCGRCDREDTLLLCDGCDSGHHLECLSPPLSVVPIEEWLCPDCEQLKQNRRLAQEVDIDAGEVDDLIEDGGFRALSLPQRRTSTVRRLPRTRASERIRRRITRQRTFRPNIIYSDSEEEDEEEITESEVKVSSTVSPKKKRKVTVRKKRVRRKTTKKGTKRKVTKKRKTTKRKTTKRKKTTAKKKTTKRKRKTTKKRTGGKRRKLKSKRGKGKKSVNQPVLTHKARLAEALGIKPPKNPWQLSVPAMTGPRSQGDLTNQRWRANIPSFSLLGSNSELDYVSEPDEYGDAILAAGVRRRVPTTSVEIARRKAITASTLISRSIITPRIAQENFGDKPISDCSVSSVSDLLGNIIQSQSILHRNRRPSLPSGDKCKKIVETISKGGGENGNQMGIGPNSSNGEDKNSVNSSTVKNQNNSSQHYYGGNVNRSSDNFYSFGRSTREDPTGSKAYSSYLRTHSDDGNSSERNPPNVARKDEKKKDKKKPEDEDVNLYSDVEPDFPTVEIEDDDDDEEQEDEDTKDKDEVADKGNEKTETNASPMSDDNLIIDDDANWESGSKQENPIILNTSGSTVNDNEVGSSNLPGLNDFELEAVSDTDTHDMDKSMNSSISLSDSNMGDAEVTSSTHEIAMRNFEDVPPRIFNIYGNKNIQKPIYGNGNPTSGGMGLDALEMETISDNEEMCFDESIEIEDNIEEGEIPSEKPPRELPSNRPKINIQLRKVIEVSSPNKEFGADGDYEEGEIVDEAAARKKREKARKEVQEIVNQGTEEEKENNPETTNNAIIVLEPNVSSSPKKFDTIEKNSLDKPLENKMDAKEQDVEKSKETGKDKDISFKKVSRNNKIRNYRDNDGKEGIVSRGRYSRERGTSRDRGLNKDRPQGRGHSRERRPSSRERGQSHDRNRNRRRSSGDRYKGGGSSRRRREIELSREPKRKEMERYNVRQMINKKEEERKKKDEFGRDVSLREVRPSRSRSKSRGHKRSSSRNRKRSLSESKKKGGNKKKSYSRSPSKSQRSKRRRSFSSSTTSSSTSTSTSSSSYSSSSSSSMSPRSRRNKVRIRSRSKSLVKKKVEKKKPPLKVKEKVKKVVTTTPKKKEDKKKEKVRKEKTNVEKDLPSKPEKLKKKRKRGKSPLQSKEVYQAGGSIMVSVNFSRNAKDNKDGKKKKDSKMDTDQNKRKKLSNKNVTSPYHQTWSSGRMSMSPSGKHTPLQDEPMWSPGNIHHHERRDIEPPKSPDDLDIIMVTPPPQEPILISDSDEEENEGITRLPPDLGVQPLSPLSRNQGGPKTPPEPGVKFTLSSKQSLKPINNPLQDEEDDNRSIVASRGPNTPPGQPPESDESVGRAKSPVERIPHSPTGTSPASSPEPDAYDPFEPTKSPSPMQRSPQQEARVSSSDQTDQGHKSPLSDSSPVKIISPPPPPLPSEPPQLEEKPPEPQKAPEDENTITVLTTPPVASALPPISAPVSLPIPIVVSKHTTLPGVVPITTAPPALVPVTSAALPMNTMQQIFAGLPANVANILCAAAVRGASNALLRPPQRAPILPPDFSRPPPPTAALLNRPPPTTISPMKISDKNKITQNGQGVIPVVDVVDMDLGSPTSPDSSDASDIFDPPSPHSTHVTEKTSPRKHRLMGQKISPVKSMKPVDKFDALFGDGRKPHAPGYKKSSASKMAKIKNIVKRNELGIEDDIPSSAVALQVKEKLIKKVQRQERVVEEVKLCLKPFYNKKTITKEDYKEIMKKCVQKVCHNRSGEINPNKIRGLVEGYIKKVKYYRKKHGPGSAGSALHPGGPVLPPTANDPPPPGFGIISKAHVKLKP